MLLFHNLQLPRERSWRIRGRRKEGREELWKTKKYQRGEMIEVRNMSDKSKNTIFNWSVITFVSFFNFLNFYLIRFWIGMK